MWLMPGLGTVPGGPCGSDFDASQGLCGKLLQAEQLSETLSISTVLDTLGEAIAQEADGFNGRGSGEDGALHER